MRRGEKLKKNKRKEKRLQREVSAILGHVFCAMFNMVKPTEAKTVLKIVTLAATQFFVCT